MKVCGYEMCVHRNGLVRAAQPVLGVSAKARLVVQGYQDRTTIHSDCTAASLLAFHILCSYTAGANLAISAADASNSHLQAGGIERI